MSSQLPLHSFTRAAVLPGIPPTRGEIESGNLPAYSATPVIGEAADDGRSPPSWGRCPAGQRGATSSATGFAEEAPP